MDLAARVQTGAGAMTILALPLVYIGGTRGVPALTVIGFVVFTAGMLVVPLLRLVAPPEGDRPAAAPSDDDAGHPGRGGRPVREHPPDPRPPRP